MSPPVAFTGCAAPIVVLGAIAATLPAITMNVAAEAARAPLGETYVITGTFDASIRWTMLRIDPPARPAYRRE